MTDPNILYSVTDPDGLIAGTSPYANFAAAYVQVYRWSSEALARAGSTGVGTLACTFTLIASTAERSDPDIAGPFRFGYYDASAGAGSWYRARFADSGLANFSPFSDPWEVDNAAEIALRDVIKEVGKGLGGSIDTYTAEANVTAGAIVITGLWKSTVRDAYLWTNQWVLVTQDAGGSGAAPEGEEALIASVDTGTGTATLERALTAAVTTGDTVLLSAWLQPSDIIKAINLAREKMHVPVSLDIALDAKSNRYPAPQGVRTRKDIISAFGVRRYANSDREDLFEIDVKPVHDGLRVWLEIGENPSSTPVARIQFLRSYREIEGELALMSDTTVAPLEWLRAAAAYEAAMMLVRSDPEEPEYARILALVEPDAANARDQFGPVIDRPMNPGAGRVVLPGPVEA